MTGSELSARLVALGMTPEQLAETLNRHPEEVKTWMRISGSLPKSLVRHIEWVLALYERERAMVASGLPECAWVGARTQEMEGVTNRAALNKYIADVAAHALHCDTCQQREAYAARLPELPPPPMPGHVRVIGKTAESIARLPRWLRPGVAGALIVGGFAVARAILEILIGTARFNSELLVAILGAIGFGAYAGLIGGFAYRLFGERLRNQGRYGHYLAGIVCSNAVVLSVALPVTIFVDDQVFRSVSGWIVFLALGTFVGLMVGHSLKRTAP